MQTGKIFNIQKFSINDGPGIRTAVFFKGCPLQCRWCSNPESQNRYAQIADAIADVTYCGRTYTVDEVMADVIKDKPFYDESGGGMTLSGGEVLQQAQFAMALSDAARAAGIHVAVETAAYAPKAVFDEFIEHVDLLLFDFKHIDRQIHYEQTGVYNDVILENLQSALSRGKVVIPRIPVIPEFNADLASADQMAQKLGDLGIKTVNLLPFHQFGEQKYEKLGAVYTMKACKQLHKEDLQAYRDIFVNRGIEASFA